MIGIGSGNSAETGTLDMYDGVKLTGNITNSSSLGSAVNILNGTFNMYGGEICDNTNYAGPALGGAVAGMAIDDTRTVNFNMYGGSIHDNETDSKVSSYSGAVMIMGGTFNMYGGDISNNNVTRANKNIYNYGGGVTLYNSTGSFEGGVISGNTGSVYGGGIYACENSSLNIKKGFTITGNTASYGGGLNFNSTGKAMIETGAVIANNSGSNGGDDIAFYGNVGGILNIGDASQMNTVVTETGEKITGWYQDALGNRWMPETAESIDITNPLAGEKYFLKAAYYKESAKFIPAYEFVSGTKGKQLPKEVIDLLPKDMTEYEEGIEISAIAPKETSVTVADGEWVFKGYDKNSKIAAEGICFVGTWEFQEKSSIPNDGSNVNGDIGNNQTQDGNKMDTSDSVSKTGDDMNIIFYAALFVISGIAAVSIFAYKRKKVK